jgi:hypothetical protein
MIYPEPEARDNIYHYPSTHVKTQNTFILASINYFDPDMSKSTNTVVYFDWKTGIFIYICGICRTQFKVIGFSSGPRPVKIDSDQCLLPIFFNRIYLNILILKFSSQSIRKSNFEDWIYAAKFEQTIIHQDEHLRRESRSHVHVLMRF